MTELELKYGCNPNQKPARIFMENGELPLKVLNGKPGYINFMDALNSWHSRAAASPPSSTSPPPGPALGLPLTDVERHIYFAPEGELSPIACAYIRARGADRLCSFGDWAALSDVCDADTRPLPGPGGIRRRHRPRLHRRGPGDFKDQAQGAATTWWRSTPAMSPPPIERRNIYGITFEQGYKQPGHQRGDAPEHRHREQGAAPAGQARHAPVPHHPEVHPVQLRVLREERHDHRRGGPASRAASTAHPPGGQQGGHLVAAPASEGSGSPVCGQQSAAPTGTTPSTCTSPTSTRTCWPRGCGRTHLQGEARSPHRRGESRLDRPDVRSHRGLRRLLPLRGTTWSGRENPACSTLPSPAAPSGTSRSSTPPTSTTW